MIIIQHDYGKNCQGPYFVRVIKDDVVVKTYGPLKNYKETERMNPDLSDIKSEEQLRLFNF